MTLRPYDLEDRERPAFQFTIAFLNGRLGTSSSIEWALKLARSQRAERTAVVTLLNSNPAEKLPEPWASAWRLIEEYWDQPEEDASAVSAHGIQQRVTQGDRSNALISAITRLVRPRLNISARGSLKGKKKSHTVHDVIGITFTSNEPIDPAKLGIGKLKDAAFLAALSASLEVAVSETVEKGKRLGWGKSLRWRLGDVRRVYYAKPEKDSDGDRESEPDEFGRGIAFATKTLHAAVRSLAASDPASARQLCARWRGSDSSIFQRLWAAIARDPKIAPAEEVEQFLLGLGDDAFWDTNNYPEISEMRAVRFGKLSAEAQKAIAERLQRLPPKSYWKGTDAARTQSARQYWAVREFRRIQGSGGKLTKKQQDWTDATAATIPDLAKPLDATWGFLGGTTVRSANPDPEAKYDSLSGLPRLKELEAALSAGRQHWENDPSERASLWIRTGDNARLIVSDFETAGARAKDFPIIWERFGWAHHPADKAAGQPKGKSSPGECRRVMSLLLELPDATMIAAIEGLTHWMSTWQNQMVREPAFMKLWEKTWPLAIDATNARETSSESFELTAVIGDQDDGGMRDLDTLNTPAGRMVGVFIAAWGAIKKGTKPFASGSRLTKLRNQIILAEGRSGLIAKHRLIELLSFFHHADSGWTKNKLLPHLTADTPSAASLWRAVARRRLDAPILRLLKPSILSRVNDVRLGRSARNALVFSIVIDAMHALLRGKAPAIKAADIQQMLRVADDQIRAHAADTVTRFVKENGASFAPDALLTKAAAPFVETIWPQERQLTTPSTSKALADLPAVSGKAFTKAVALIERFLVPFDCWSMLDYGLWGNEDSGPKLANIDSAAKGKAFLHLLNLTIGENEGAIVPFDLGEALAQISTISPALAEQPSFRRLSAAAR